MFQRPSGKEVARWWLHFFRVTIEGFLAPYTKWRPRHSCEPLRVDVSITLLALPKAAFVDTKDSRPDISQLVKFAVEITDRECVFRGLLDFFQLIGGSLNSDTVAMADEPL
jgi:hypothetical protein